MDRRDFVKTSGWSVLGLAAAGSLLGCSSQDSKRIPAEARERFAKMRDLRIWWGDVHNHCNVTYGHGDLVDALAAAREQLDFCSVTPHAMWPDMPHYDDPGMEWVMNYHREAFARLRRGGL